MKSRIFLGFLVLLILFLICFLPSFAYYDFLSPKSNAALEIFKKEFREEKEIVCEKEGKVLWKVILPQNSGVETKEVVEEIEGHIYTITEITILNAQGPTEVALGSASDVYPYDIPKLCFR